MPDTVYKVMLSSTFRDLREEREAVIGVINSQGMLPLIMETDYAIPDLGIISSSYAKVDEADAYVVLIGNYRYGQVIDDPDDNPDGLSVTELEFRRAEERGLPLCIYLMDEDVPVFPRETRKEAPWADKLQRFRERAQHPKRNFATFKTTDELKAAVMWTLARLKEVLKERSRPEPAPSAAATTLPHPPAFYAQPPYTPGHPFEGRATELALLNTWATSPEPVLLFQAIGGMGKSSVTWEWVTNHATKARGDWAGRLWYSFYERGADMRDFTVTALAYITGHAPESFQGQREAELVKRLLAALGQRPWLLVLDGLERVLAAYHRSDAAQMRDDQIDLDTGMGGRKPADGIRRADDDLLRALAGAGPSKLLITSRLMPRALLNVSDQPLLGVKRELLPGLAPEDAEAMVRRVGITGDSRRIQRYLTEFFAGHPLVVGFVAGLIRKSLWARMDFDVWVDDARGGRAVDLTSPDLTTRHTNVLKLAFDALTPEVRLFLGRMGMVSNAAGFDVLEALNPMRPDPPQELMVPAREWDFERYWIWTQPRMPASDEQRALLERMIAGHDKPLLNQFETARQGHAEYHAALNAWRQSSNVRDAAPWLNHTLLDLEARGLVQVDHHAGRCDLHPVVRGYAVKSMDTSARRDAGQRVADVFFGRSRFGPEYYSAASLREMADDVQVIEALSLAENLPEAWNILNAMRGALQRLEHHNEPLALLRPFFPDGFSAPPAGNSDVGIIAGMAAQALSRTGRIDEADAQGVISVGEDIARGLSQNLAMSVQNHHQILRLRNAVAQAGQALRLAGGVSASVCDQRVVIWCDLSLVNYLIDRGNLTEARAVWNKATSRPVCQEHDAESEAHFLTTESRLLMREGAQTDARLRTAVDRAEVLGQRRAERSLWNHLGVWHQDAGRDEPALAAFDHALQMARDAGLDDTESEARRGLSLARLGDRASAQAAAVAAERDPPHDALATLYLALDDRPAALRHATEGFKYYRADGPPYCWHWRLEECRTVLRTLGTPEPSLPPVDPVKIEKLPYEDHIQRLLAEHAKKPPSRPATPI